MMDTSSGCSSVGRAPVLGTGSRTFDSCHSDLPNRPGVMTGSHENRSVVPSTATLVASQWGFAKWSRPGTLTPVSAVQICQPQFQQFKFKVKGETKWQEQCFASVECIVDILMSSLTEILRLERSGRMTFRSWNSSRESPLRSTETGFPSIP